MSDAAGAPVRDPRRSLRAVGSGLLFLEALTVMFAMLAVFGTSHTAGHVAHAKLAALGGLAAAMLIASAVQRRSFGRYAGSALQVAGLAIGVTIWPLLFVVVLFGPMWAVYLRWWHNLAAELAQVG